MRKLLLAALVVSSTAAVAGCQETLPPTVTPGPYAAPTTGSTVVELTVPPPPQQRAAPANVPPVVLGELVLYRDAGGLFSLDIPPGWSESRQQGLTGDVKLGTVFQPPQQNGLITITQFDNGQRPQSIGLMANQVMGMTGVMEQPDFRELSRSDVIEREGEAMMVELTFTRGDGTPMHSLVLFQLDGTVFSMVNASVAGGSWVDNESRIRRVLKSYRVPAVPLGG